MSLQYPDDRGRHRPGTAARALRANHAIGFDLGDGAFSNPKYPQPETLDEERLLRRQRLAIAFRVFARLGFDDGAAGHITARDPEHTDHFWVNPVGCPWGLLRVRDLLLVGPDGDVVEGSGRVNLPAFTIHSRVHAARPDVVAAAHAHTPAGRALASLHQPLEPLNQDACAFYGDHALANHFGGVVNTDDEGALVTRALGNCKAAVLGNHGLITVGHTVDSA
ncbi:MAG: class II aldolase/adducin family protein, partial [Acidimicrobiales bacterium]|nr:class II aldolase/adducin family protein [Acidimicrobiales bacterium]